MVSESVYSLITKVVLFNRFSKEFAPKLPPRV